MTVVDLDGQIMVLHVMDVHSYDKNPRQAVIPKFQEIKAGIRERRKLPGSLAVTNMLDFMRHPQKSS